MKLWVVNTSYMYENRHLHAIAERFHLDLFTMKYVHHIEPEWDEPDVQLNIVKDGDYEVWINGSLVLSAEYVELQ